jgi:hypothetical protein
MKTKFLFLLAALTFSFSVLALAQKKNDPTRSPQQNPPVIQQLPGKIVLSCQSGNPGDVSTPLNIKNPTAQDVPAGTTIHWSAKKGAGNATGKQTTTQVLLKNNGNQISVLGPPDNIASCQAWYFKK